MNSAELASQIRKTWEYSKAVGVGEIFSHPVALIASDKFKEMSVDGDVSYEELYLFGLRNQQYNILLKDFSFFQFGFGKEDGVRFAYYPNPFLGAAPQAVAEITEMQEYLHEGIIDIDEFLHRISEIRKPRHPPLVRYEYSKSQYVPEYHPCSHFHLGFHGENRWPVRRFLSAHAFSLLIMRTYYFEFWKAGSRIKHGDNELDLDDLLVICRSDSRLLQEDEFSQAESGRFHFS